MVDIVGWGEEAFEIPYLRTIGTRSGQGLKQDLNTCSYNETRSKKRERTYRVSGAFSWLEHPGNDAFRF